MEGFSTGYPWIDWVGGQDVVDSCLFPRGGVTEVAGLQQTGKTTLLLETIAFNQQLYRELGRVFRVLWVDLERTLLKQRPLAQALGVVFDKNFQYVQPLTLEAGGQFIIERCRPGAGKKAEPIPDLIVVDTLAAARPAIEYTNKLGQTKMPGIRGKLWSEFFRNLMPELTEDGPAVVMINHLMTQMNIGGFQSPVHNDLESPGSNSLRLWACARYFLKFKGKVKQKLENPFTYEEQNMTVAVLTEIEAQKSKFGAPYRFATFQNYFGTGISPVPRLFDVALAKGEKTRKPLILVYQNGSRFDVLKKPGDDESGMGLNVIGKENFLAELENNPDALRVLGTNTNELWAHQVETWVNHPKHTANSDSGQMHRVDIAEEDMEALRKGVRKTMEEAGASEGEIRKAEEEAVSNAKSESKEREPTT